MALSPMFVLAVLLLSGGIALGDFYKVQLIVVFLVTLIYAVATTRGETVGKRVEILSRGAGEKNLLLMIWIFLLAGAFAQTAKAMGAIDATVNLTLSLLPAQLLLPGLFLAACLVSLSIGTSVGTIVALVPIAAGMSEPTGIELPLLVASVVGGSFFGDNLSFISDTTIAATRTQGVKLSDKFKMNFKIALPAAIVTFVILMFMGFSGEPQTTDIVKDFDLWKVLPYVLVIALAIYGFDVMLVLVLGNLSAAVIGLIYGDLGICTWMQNVALGMTGMTETILVALMAGGLMELIRHNGGIGYLIYHLTRGVTGRKGAEASIALLVSVTNCCTANNTVAILSVGKISADIADRFGVDRRKSASLLDTFSCVVQGLIPYGAQLLLAGSLAAINSVAIIPYLYYNVLLGVCATIAIFTVPGHRRESHATADPAC